MPKLTQGFKDGEQQWFEGGLPEGWELTQEDTPNEGTVAWLELQLKTLNINIPDDALKVDLEKLYSEATEG